MDDRVCGGDLVSVWDELADRRRALPPAEAEHLAAAIERAVWCETRGRERNLGVEVGTDGVVLTGFCHTYYIKQMAQHAAMSVPGSTPLVNEIEVM